MSNNDKRKNKPVYFSLADEFEVKLLEHAEKINPLTNKPQNFSKYVKRLIEEDMKREVNGGNDSNGITIEQNLPVLQKEEGAYSIEVKNAMSSFL